MELLIQPSVERALGEHDDAQPSRISPGLVRGAPARAPLKREPRVDQGGERLRHHTSKK
jgi:hypothetical protein